MWLKSDQGSKIVRPCHYRESRLSHERGKDEKRLNGFFLLHGYHLRAWLLRVKDKSKHSGERENEVALDLAVIRERTLYLNFRRFFNILNRFSGFKASVE